MEKRGTKTAAVNRKASHDYFIEARYEAGIELCGTEVKSIRQGALNLKDAYCSVKDGELLHVLELPLAGLISLKPAKELAKDSQKMKEANRALGLVDMENPLLRIVTLALPVIPNVKMSDLGMVDVLKKELIPLFA